MHGILFALIIVVIGVVFSVYRYTKKNNLRKCVENNPFKENGANIDIGDVTNDVERDRKDKQHENQSSDQAQTKNSKRKGAKKLNVKKKQ